MISRLKGMLKTGWNAAKMYSGSGYARFLLTKAQWSKRNAKK